MFGLEDAHAKYVITLKYIQQALANALIENTSTHDRVASFQMVVDETDKIIWI